MLTTSEPFIETSIEIVIFSKRNCSRLVATYKAAGTTASLTLITFPSFVRNSTEPSRTLHNNLTGVDWNVSDL